MAKKKDGSGDDQTDRGTVAGSAPTEIKPYVVLARKYRPETFDELIGQAAMVTTLSNAFATNRIAQGYMLTGVRGVGKTTTARILARALNYAKEGLPDRPTVAMDGYGIHCRDIIASRHPDVVEMDAASNTSVDNVREIIESARYKPISARMKVFIIDEVHMLSKGAFNALLKTLEEPPGHVKFIFATTEIRKVPVTVLSRCQRFDLRRVDVPELSQHFSRIAEKEGAAAEPEALALIARASEGSVRDGLSILDQAIAMGSGKVDATQVRAMLGLTDRGRLFDLLELAFGGQAGPMLDAFSSLHHDGADPAQLLADLAEAVHIAMRTKIAGVDATVDVLSAEEKRRAGMLAGQLSVAILSRAWQLLLKGLDEVGRAPNTKAAAEMVLIRLAYTADLPTPDEVIRMLGGSSPAPLRSAPPPPAATTPDVQRGPSNVVPAARPGPKPAPGSSEPERVQAASKAPPAAELPPWESDDGPEMGEGLESESENPAPAPVFSSAQTFADVVELAGLKRDAKLKIALEDKVSLVRFELGRIELNPSPGAPATLANELAEKLKKWTGRPWVVALSRERGDPPLGEVRRAREIAERAELAAHPAIKAVLAAFPDAEIKEIKPLGRLDNGDRTDEDETGTG